MACTAWRALGLLAARMTGMIPSSAMRREDCSMFIGCRVCGWIVACSSLDSGGIAFHKLEDLWKRGHAGIARSGHGQGSVSGAAIDGPLGVFVREEAVDETGDEGVTAANAIVNFQIFAIGCGIEAAVSICDGAPIIESGGAGVTQSCGYDSKVRECLEYVLDHGFEIFLVAFGGWG